MGRDLPSGGVHTLFPGTRIIRLKSAILTSMKYLIGLIVIAIGSFMVIKTEKMLEAFGRVDFAERKFFEYGGSRFFYKMLGLLVIFGAFIGFFGFWENILNATIGPLFDFFRE